MQDHLGNHCSKVTKKVGDYYCALVSLRDNSNGDPTQAESLPRGKKRKTSHQPLITDHMDSTNIISARQSRIDQAAILAFTCAGIPFRVIKNPFFIDWLKELNAGYQPPSRDYLLGRLLNQELAKVNNAIKKEFQGEINLTLGKLNDFSIILLLIIICQNNNFLIF